MTVDRRPVLCVFAKPPVAGTVKTRLAGSLGTETAARLARAFLADTWDAVRAVPWLRPVLCTTERFSGESEVGAHNVWLQGRGDLGERIERTLRRALLRAPAALAIGADTPGLPAPLLAQARDALDSADAALGPCDDGGFYLIGLKRCPRGLLRELPWSSPLTCDRTLSRLRARGLKTTVLAPWFDVDRPADLERLQLLLARGQVSAPHTARVLAQGDFRPPAGTGAECG